MNERLKELRLILGLSQEEFGLKIGIKSRAHISSLENGTRNITDRIVGDICSSYNVHEEWLRNGNGEMFLTPSTFSLDEYAKLNGLTDKDRIIIREFMALDSSAKNAVYNMLEKVFLSEEWHGDNQNNYYDEITKDPKEFEKEFQPIEPKESKII